MLRDLTMDDAPSVQRVYSGASVRFTTGEALTAAKARAKVANILVHARAVPREHWCFGVIVADDLIGLAKFRCRTRSTASINYVLRDDMWGNGYATEAVRRLARFAFAVPGLDRLTARHHPENPASGRVLAKSGFVCTGCDDDDYVTYELRQPSRPRRQGRT
ncbi:GNAT family N-acetyltransferase [Streptomyces sp. NPDC093109]|uniref:GNAT family N-acetyltransferase n=1 Tax=Streptomyces sp. NPDC093109 TaxID=3154977 RepID=UPI00344CA67D